MNFENARSRGIIFVILYLTPTSLTYLNKSILKNQHLLPS